MTMHGVFVMDVVEQGVLRLVAPNRPSDERLPVTYGPFCLVPRVSVHDRYCTMLLSSDELDIGPTIVTFRLLNVCTVSRYRRLNAHLCR